MKPRLDPAYLPTLLRYEPETGKLFWLVRPRELFSSDRMWRSWNTRYAGKEALACINHYGYREGPIFGRLEKAHRVVWALVYGQWPEFEIDHDNGIRSDNRFKNLKPATHMENSRNRWRSQRNSSGTTGVYWRADIQKWTAKIGLNSVVINLGSFANFDDAAAARTKAERQHGFSDRHGAHVPSIVFGKTIKAAAK